MCLRIKARKTRKPPVRRVAYKVVQRDRQPRIWSHKGAIVYKKGSVHEVMRGQITSRIQDTAVHFGFHVYTTLKRAQMYMGRDYQLIKVAVRPKDWVADGHEGDAVYCKLKVLT